MFTYSNMGQVLFVRLFVDPGIHNFEALWLQLFQLFRRQVGVLILARRSRVHLLELLGGGGGVSVRIHGHVSATGAIGSPCARLSNRKWFWLFSAGKEATERFES